MDSATNSTQDQNPNKEITLFAKTNFRNKEVPFGIKIDDRRRHMYIIGKTGMGKTTMMENMIIQDIMNGNGLAFVDPHGDSVEKILNYIPNSRVNDVVYVNPSDLDFPISFNILESVDPRYKHLVASGLMGVFTKIWAGVWSPRMEYIMNNAILALLDSPGNTLLGVARLLVDKKYRKKIVDNIKDPVVKSFWIDEYANWTEKYRTESIAAIQNKIGQFLSTSLVRNIVGQPRSTIDLRDIMDNKKILLLNLSKGRLGEDSSALLGAMIITKLQLAALSRVDLPEEKREDFYLYVDEFQNFATQSFATILSEARKYRLNLIIGHQYIGQLVKERNTEVRDAVFGNVGTICTFRIGAEDAEFLEKEFMPTFLQNDLVNLPKHTIILRLMINGVASDPFTAVTLAPSTYVRTDNIEKVIRISRERYANPVKDVEEKIMRWLGQDYHESIAVIAANSESEQEAVVRQAIEDQEPATVQTQAIIQEQRPASLQSDEDDSDEHDIPQMVIPQPIVSQPKSPLIFPDMVSQRQQQPAQKSERERRNPQRQMIQNQSRPQHQINSNRNPQRNQNQQRNQNPIWDQVNKSAGKNNEQKNKQLADNLANSFKVVLEPGKPTKVNNDQ